MRDKMQEQWEALRPTKSYGTRITRGPQHGDEWSVSWGGSEMLWYITILPRIHSFLPAENVLEIASGFGRVTQYLKQFCGHLTVVDLSERCIEFCKQRFSANFHISYRVNDGKSLAMIPDNSLDFVFSFDSLVHVEEDVIEAYLLELAKKLKKDAIGFIHHSNLGDYRRDYAWENSVPKFAERYPRTKGILRKIWPAELHHGRSFSVTAEKFNGFAQKAGLKCVSQEIFNWGTRNRFTDCFSVIARVESNRRCAPQSIKNGEFPREVGYSAYLSSIYGEKKGGIK